ncbi:GtrA family protein [Altererythrobacter aerius]|uniref:GtrA family protein n=1 Tax=Tsuneonella aeria TaxID=1837929 RepID=A0A6I4TFB0_9SPHN|nr:GtrA family protein [Tsuneonella aeria]MXO75307.1 GtrA family protein [Tsuneonella aeria]
MFSAIARLTDQRLVRYVLASVGALAVDLGCFLTLLSLGLPAALSSAAGYCLGIAAHWLLSSRAVFADAVAEHGRERTRQKALFVGSAFAGLALTTVIVGAADLAGLDPRIAKVGAVAASFALTWALRSRVVFAARAPA